MPVTGAAHPVGIARPTNVVPFATGYIALAEQPFRDIAQPGPSGTCAGGSKTGVQQK
jgi:hypothetical protein